jgi:hypothetical protein
MKAKLLNVKGTEKSVPEANKLVFRRAEFNAK